MHIETFKTFCDLVETGSFSRAATLNFVTQSAVSQQVKALEQRFGVELIDRSSRRSVVLTAAGRSLYDSGREILRAFNALEDRVKSSEQRIAGEVRIATVYSVGLHELPPFLKSFIRKHPRVHVHLEYHRTNLVYEACLDNAIDFGIVALPQARPQLEIKQLKGDDLVLICSPEHALSKRRRVSIKRIEGEPMITFERDIPTRREIDAILRRYQVTVRIAMEFDNVETIKRSVEADIGIAILPDTAVASEVKNGQLHSLNFTEGPFHRPVGIIHRKGKIFSAAASELIATLTNTDGS